MKAFASHNLQCESLTEKHPEETPQLLIHCKSVAKARRATEPSTKWHNQAKLLAAAIWTAEQISGLFRD